MTNTKNNTHNQQGNGGFLAGVILGGVIGVAVTLFTSPKSGREVRTYLDEKAAMSRERLTVRTKEVREKAEPMVGGWIKVANEKAAPVLNLVKDKTRETAELKQQVDEGELSIEEAMEKADQLVAEAEADVKEQLDRANESQSNEAKESSKSVDAADEKAKTGQSTAQETNSSDKKSNNNSTGPINTKPVGRKKSNNKNSSTKQEPEFEASVKDLLDDEAKQDLKELKDSLKNSK